MSMRRIPRVGPTDFTRTPAEKAVDPELGYGMIDKLRYTSPEFMALEWERLWKKVWLMACREDDLPEPGDYMATEIGHESIVVVRQPDRSIRAFYNVCLHRGNRLVLAETGRAESFKCAYHLWEYALDGKFLNIPDLDTFPQGAPCDGLAALPCDVWGGFVWFSLDRNVMPLAEYLGIIPQHLGPYHFERMAMTRDYTVEWDCNWKASVDAFNETYHVQGIHPELLHYLDDVDVQIDCYERHNRYLIAFNTLSARLDDTPQIPPLIDYVMRETGMDPAEFQGSALQVRRALQEWKRKHGPEFGLDYSELNDDQLTDDYHYLIFPNITLNVHADTLMLFRQRPHPTDPNKMFYDLQNFRLLKTGEARPERPEHLVFKHGEQTLGKVLDQDAYNLPGVQAGMRSEGFPGLWLGKQELRIRHFHKTLDDYLFSPNAR